MNVAVYIGSFDPVHKSHTEIAKACSKRKDVDRTLIIATGDYWNKKLTYTLQERISMLKMVCPDKVEVDEKYNSYEYTYQIFRMLEKENPANNYKLVVGSDNLPKFRQWQQSDYLLQHDLIVVERIPFDKKYIKRWMEENKKDNYEILDLEPIEISSTYIRENKTDWNLLKGKIDKKVFKYINKEREI